MRRAAFVLSLSIGCSKPSAPAPMPPPPPVEAPSFAVVELFTSEGCSSCPAAEDVLHDLGDATGVIALAFHVDYWNGTWSDRFSSRKVTQRQRDYAVSLGTGLYTPEMIVNGTAQFLGSHRAEANARISDALAVPAHAKLSLVAKRISKTELSITCQSTPELEDTELVIALTERDLFVTPTAGENAGAALRHDHVVRAFTTLDGSHGTGTVSLAHPADVRIEKSRLVAFLQKSDRSIVAATTTAAP